MSDDLVDEDCDDSPTPSLFYDIIALMFLAVLAACSILIISFVARVVAWTWGWRP